MTHWFNTESVRQDLYADRVHIVENIYATYITVVVTRHEYAVFSWDIPYVAFYDTKNPNNLVIDSFRDKFGILGL